MDLVERQDVMNICLNHNGRGYAWASIMRKVSKLPSVHPKISCDGCGYRGRPTTDMPCCLCMRKEGNDYYKPEK